MLKIYHYLPLRAKVKAWTHTHTRADGNKTETFCIRDKLHPFLTEMTHLIGNLETKSSFHLSTKVSLGWRLYYFFINFSSYLIKVAVWLKWWTISFSHLDLSLNSTEEFHSTWTILIFYPLNIYKELRINQHKNLFL